MSAAAADSNPTIRNSINRVALKRESDAIGETVSCQLPRGTPMEAEAVTSVNGAALCSSIWGSPLMGWTRQRW